MSNPYMSGPHQFEVEGGVEACFTIRAPHRGAVTQIKFNQLDGDVANCDFEVYTSRNAVSKVVQVELGSYSNSSSSSFSSSSAGSNLPNNESPASYSIFGEKTYIGGTPTHISDESHSFRNQDGTYSVPERKLYVRLLPSGTGPKTYTLTLEMLTSLLQ